ncbi:chorismate mutase [Streptomyces sp. NBC_00986]|uniref:chorismate mutase n=1 Tax=Streptomyces sp. NBC_00986 TaxID=2903702 RepID=UPI0038676932|nr:chorismate mutase [Streptomyces sp. NBC_00986]WSX64550.1 chorismate mutase [Streptomyces sp. NBC_00986]
MTTARSTAVTPDLDTGIRGNGADADQAATTIRGHRALIDTIDTRIIGLVKERAELSAQVQTARMSTGGPRVCVSRETQIIGHYSDEFGRFGVEFAKLLLRVSRGPN